MKALKRSGVRRPPGDEPEVVRYDFGKTSIAAVAVALSPQGVAAIAIRKDYDEEMLLGALRARFPRAILQHDTDATRSALEAVVAFVEHPRRNLDLRLDIRGTDFQRSVWTAVLAVPFGETTTFAEVAARLGAPRAVRAVGNACSANPLEFAIPCHRVLRRDGSWSGGSAWGDWRQSTIVGRECSAAKGKGETR
jgi:AraC family transcriptional regulator of adaptative response/methylated-DNA-[protein]-cysteine methyltransferase